MDRLAVTGVCEASDFLGMDTTRDCHAGIPTVNQNTKHNILEWFGVLD